METTTQDRFEIVVEREQSDTDRGWHDRNARITFLYHDSAAVFVPAIEDRILKAITGGPAENMWWSIKSREEVGTDVVYVVHYGYDSGD